MKLLHCLPLHCAFGKAKRTQTIENMRRQLCVDDDLIYEILQRLPIKALLRFKSVSKSWKKMIEDPYLDLKQLRRPIHEDTTDMKLLMVHYSMSGTKEFTAVISKEMIEIATPENQEYELDCDCNGLYLFYHDKDRSLPLSLFNPVTRETIQLPHASASAHPESKHIREVHGLGFDVGNAMFKVIRFTMDIDFVCRKPEILILCQKSWKQLELPACLQGIPDNRTIFVNGAIHCLFRTRDHHILIAFDIVNEEFRSIKFPNISVSCGKLLNRGGSLAMLLRCNGAAPGSYSVYLLKDYKKGEWCSVEGDHMIMKSADKKKSSNVSVIIGNQVILSNSGSDLFFDMETRERIVKEKMVQIAKMSPNVANYVPINQLSLLPLSQYMTCKEEMKKPVSS